MKILKILAVIMAVCLLGSAFIACDKADGGTETTADTKGAAAETVTIKLIIKDGSVTKYEGSTKCDGTLGNAIEMYCAGEFEGDAEIFDNNNLLATIGELSAGNGKNWKAYYEDEGQSNAFESIKAQVVENGRTVVLVLQ